MIVKGQLVLNEDESIWGRVDRTWTDAYGTDRVTLSYWLNRPNFQVYAEADKLHVVAEHSEEHRLMLLAEKLVLVATAPRVPQLARLREILASIPTGAKAADFLAAARAIKHELIGRQRGLPTIPLVTKLIREFVAQ